jgi:transcriptional regulator with XRE-family HTH domain
MPAAYGARGLDHPCALSPYTIVRAPLVDRSPRQVPDAHTSLDGLQSGSWQQEAHPLGPRLRDLRLRAGLSQKQLADFSTLSVRAIRDIEGGRVRRLRQDTLHLLFEALGLTDSQRKSLEHTSPAVAKEIVKLPTGLEEAAHSPMLNGCLRPRVSEMRALMHIFGPMGRRLVIASGIEGVGKTRLALELAQTFSIREGTAVVWVPLGDRAPKDDEETATTASAEGATVDEPGMRAVPGRTVGLRNREPKSCLPLLTDQSSPVTPAVRHHP